MPRIDILQLYHWLLFNTDLGSRGFLNLINYGPSFKLYSQINTVAIDFTVADENKRKTVRL